MYPQTLCWNSRVVLVTTEVEGGREVGYRNEKREGEIPLDYSVEKPAVKR
jgi:hypothetical protein